MGLFGTVSGRCTDKYGYDRAVKPSFKDAINHFAYILNCMKIMEYDPCFSIICRTLVLLQQSFNLFLLFHHESVLSVSKSFYLVPLGESVINMSKVLFLVLHCSAYQYNCQDIWKQFKLSHFSSFKQCSIENVLCIWNIFTKLIHHFRYFQ